LARAYKVVGEGEEQETRKREHRQSKGRESSLSLVGDARRGSKSKTFEHGVGEGPVLEGVFIQSRPLISCVEDPRDPKSSGPGVWDFFFYNRVPCGENSTNP